MIRSEAKLVFACLLGVALPAGVLHFTANADRHLAGLTAAPFAWPRLLVAHLVTALPLGLIVARWLCAIPAANGAAAILWPVLGLATTGIAAVLCPQLAEVLAGGEFGAIPLLVLRSTLSFVLVLPWCVWATAPAQPQQSRINPGVLFGVGLGLATLPCGLYAEAVVTARTATATEWVSTDRLAKAERVLAGLCELGSDRRVAGKPPSEVRRQVNKQRERLERSAAQPLSPSASPAVRFARAGVLIQLDRLDEAAELLRPLTSVSPVATLLLASVDRDRERWAESDAGYEAALTRLLPKASTDPVAGEWCRLALEGLAYNARMDRRPADSERMLRRGLEHLPADAAHFHFLLGQHFRDGGRPTLAIEHLRAAANLNPTKYQEPVERMVQQLQTSTPACLPRWFR